MDHGGARQFASQGELSGVLGPQLVRKTGAMRYQEGVQGSSEIVLESRIMEALFVSLKFHFHGSESESI